MTKATDPQSAKLKTAKWVLEHLYELGASFSVGVPNQWGTEPHLASPEELLEFLKDPVSLYASHYGVSKAQYLGWQRDGCTVRCAGKTAKGKRCKNSVPGGSNVDAKTWVEMQGQYCNVHGG